MIARRRADHADPGRADRAAARTADLRGRRYRFGFHLCRRGEMPDALASWFSRHGWRAIDAGAFVLTLHPEARHSAFERLGATLHFVGDVWTESGGEPGEQIASLARSEAWLESLAEDLCGRFALLVVEGDRVRALNDAIGSQSIFYTRAGPLALSSHTDLAARTAGAVKDIDLADLLRDPGYLKRARSLPGGCTVYRDVTALTPNTLYDSDRGGCARYWPREPLGASSEAAFHDSLTRHMRGLQRYVSARYSPVFGLTGGVDTRLAIASLPLDRNAVQHGHLGGRRAEAARTEDRSRARRPAAGHEPGAADSTRGRARRPTRRP